MSFIKFLMKVHNFSGVSSIKYENHKFAVSKPFLVYNIINVLSLLILRCWIHSAGFYFDEILVDTFILEPESSFQTNIYLVTYYCVYLATLPSVLISLFRQKKIVNFLNKCLKVEISVKSSIKLQENVKMFSTIVLGFFVIDCTIQFLVYYKINFLAILFNYIELFPVVITLSTLTATKNFEMFFVVAIEQIKNHLVTNKLENSADIRRLNEVLKNYQNLCSLCEEFNEIFGPHLTSMIFHFTVFLTFRVIMNL